MLNLADRDYPSKVMVSKRSDGPMPWSSQHSPRRMVKGLVRIPMAAVVIPQLCILGRADGFARHRGTAAREIRVELQLEDLVRCQLENSATENCQVEGKTRGKPLGRHRKKQLHCQPLGASPSTPRWAARCTLSKWSSPPPGAAGNPGPPAAAAAAAARSPCQRR